MASISTAPTVPTSPLSRIVIAGATHSTSLTLQALIRHHAPIVGVLQLREASAHTVTSFEVLDEIAGSAGIPCSTFRNINDEAVIEQVKQWQPDLMFVVGLSQLVGAELLAVPKFGSIGFHPTFLPSGRGRAPFAWLVLDGAPGAATFFLMDEGCDSGPIFVQRPFEVTPRDYASDVAAKLDIATVAALDEWLPKFLRGEWNPRPQDEVLATYNGKRGPDDGLIDWDRPATEIHALIRAASDPHPGAYCYISDRKLIVWRAELELHLPWRGVPGRVLLTCPNRGSLVQTGDGLLWLSRTQFADESHVVAPQTAAKVGMKLGYVLPDEVARLKARLAAVEAKLESLGK